MFFQSCLDSRLLVNLQAVAQSIKTTPTLAWTNLGLRLPGRSDFQDSSISFKAAPAWSTQIFITFSRTIALQRYEKKIRQILLIQLREVEVSHGGWQPSV